VLRDVIWLVAGLLGQGSQGKGDQGWSVDRTRVTGLVAVPLGLVAITVYVPAARVVM